jgi:hypothetical protein
VESSLQRDGDPPHAASRLPPAVVNLRDHPVQRLQVVVTRFDELRQALHVRVALVAAVHFFVEVVHLPAKREDQIPGFFGSFGLEDSIEFF